MIHVYPINDIEEHDTENTICWYVPEITEKYVQIIVIHNAFDSRTLKENENTRTAISND